MDRRELLKAASAMAAVGMLGSAGTSAQAQQAEKKPVALKISSQDGRIPGKSLREKVEKLEKWGGCGLEVGGGGLAGRVKEIQEAIKGTGVKVSAICAGYVGCADLGQSRRTQEGRRVDQGAAQVRRRTGIDRSDRRAGVQQPDQAGQQRGPQDSCRDDA